MIFRLNEVTDRTKEKKKSQTEGIDNEMKKNNRCGFRFRAQNVCEK